MKKYIGSHFSSVGGLDTVFKKAKKINADAISFFVKNPRRWFENDINYDTIKSFKNNLKKYNFKYSQILPHAGYLINLCNPIKKKLNLSKTSLLHELIRCKNLGIKYLNIHPGNYLEKDNYKFCLKTVSNSINEVLSQIDDISIVIENTSGHGTSIGYSFEHLYEIINSINHISRVGICIDTCHLFSYGYDISTIEGIEKVFYRFNDLIGFNYLKGLHLNNSIGCLGSKIDRHENLDFGLIKKSVFSFIIKNKKFNEIPIILETKKKEYRKNEIKWLKSFI
ncbi:deoxyribonuclease IV [Buchnera aphidicola (Ceratoglyphina bambusae)]|uniref:deoxyribonuclease IV n=1 Tax=Buchnera aphidicola TaxID=9 RepID=UPI0031B8483C